VYLAKDSDTGRVAWSSEKYLHIAHLDMYNYSDKDQDYSLHSNFEDLAFGRSAIYELPHFTEGPGKLLAELEARR
jgi:hypothetical protein